MTQKYYETVAKWGWNYLLSQWADKNKITDEGMMYNEELSRDLYRGIPRDKDELEKIEFLDLHSCFYTLLVNLKILSLSDNLLEKLPDSLINCEDLEILDISANRLTSINKDCLGLIG